MIDSVICAFSRGKDSMAVLDLCSRQFNRIEAFFMYWVRGLEFEEACLRWAEAKYGIKIYRVPHFEIPRVMSSQSLTWYRPSAPDFRTTRTRDIEDHVRRHFNNEITWIASGERKGDSLERRAMLSASGEWDKSRLHYYPLMDWSTRQVWNYNRVRQLPRPAEYTYLRRSWSGFLGEDLFAIRTHFPSDYRKIIDVFPFCEVITRRYELFADRSPKKKRSAKLSGAVDQSIEAEGSSVQPATH